MRVRYAGRWVVRDGREIESFVTVEVEMRASICWAGAKSVATLLSRRRQEVRRRSTARIEMGWGRRGANVSPRNQR